MRVIVPGIIVWVVASLPAGACMRPELDDRAVQWSSAIVEARLTSIGPEIELGETTERRGPIGALGTAVTTYFYRVYEFSVTSTLDGAARPGDKVPVIRLFSQTKNPPLGCAQHLVPKSVGKEFLLLLRSMSSFKYVVPIGVRRPEVPQAMWVVHLEPAENVKPELLDGLKARIAAARAVDQQATPERVDRLIDSVQTALNDAQAGPAVRALEKMGPNVVPAIQQAAEKSRGVARTRLLQIVGDITPTEPIYMIQSEPVAQNER